MEIKKLPHEIYQEYNTGKEYNENAGLYEMVEKNWRFYSGDQWHGVNAPNLQKPVFNIIKRVTSYFVAMLVSDDISVHLTPFEETDQAKIMSQVVSREIEAVIERAKIKAKSRLCIRNCCIDADTDMYINFNPDKETGQPYKGEIEAEIIDNVNLIFGNPYDSDVQAQPYILIVQRLYTKQVKDMAERYGLSDEDIDKIIPDDDIRRRNYDTNLDKDLTTVITKLWKEKKEVPAYKNGLPAVDPLDRSKVLTEEAETVHCIKVTKEVVLKKEIDLDYKLYPVSHMSWEKNRNSYHGKSPLTQVIPNQIFINKIFAMAMVYATNNAFPKTIYDTVKLGKLTNDVTQAYGVANLEMAGQMMKSLQSPDFSGQVMQLIDSTVNYTKDTMGASDAALGNVRPDNTSAIVAVQQATAVPLEIQKLAYYDFVEDMVREIIDVMANSYGKRKVKVTEQEAEGLGLVQKIADPMTGQIIEQPTTSLEIDFEGLKHINYNLDVSIGQSTYWNETTQIQTMDNLYSKGIITDPVVYLEGIPDKYIPNKAKIIEDLKKAQQEQQELAQMQAQQEQLQAMAAQEGA